MPGKRDIYISILKSYQRAVSKRQEFSSFSNENCRVRTPNLWTYTMKNESNWLHGLKILVYWKGKCTPQQRCQDGNHLRLSENGDLRIHVKFCVGEWPTDGMPPHNWYSTTSRSSQTTWWKSKFQIDLPGRSGILRIGNGCAVYHQAHQGASSQVYFWSLNPLREHMKQKRGWK